MKTEKQIWLKIAEAFEKAAETGVYPALVCGGLCFAVDILTPDDVGIFFAMEEKIKSIPEEAKRSDDEDWYWPIRTKEGSLERAKWARIFAERCE